MFPTLIGLLVGCVVVLLYVAFNELERMVKFDKATDNWYHHTRNDEHVFLGDPSWI